MVQYNDGTSRNAVVQAGVLLPYECCVACQQTANCIYSDLLFDECELVIAPTCSPGNTFGTLFETRGSIGPGEGFIISNGGCGRVANGGSK